MAKKSVEHVRYGLWDRIWRDGNGNVVIWQTPNIWLLTWAIVTFVSLFFHGGFGTILSVIGDIFLIIWAALELFKGVNYFRRALGFVVLILAILSLLNNF